MTRTGKAMGRWAEYSEQPPGHSVGYFWMRDDGLRFGYRAAGKYYRRGTTHVPVRPPLSADKIKGAPSGAYFDRAKAFDVIGDLRESAKLEYHNDHLRVMKDGEEIELIEEIDGVPIWELDQRDFDFLGYFDRRYPRR